jgi:hypothetical protein
VPQKAIAEALAIWREAERLLEELPENHPERKVIQFELVQARAVYRSLTTRQALSRDVIDGSRDTLQQAWKTLERSRDRIHGEAEPGGSPATT